MSERIAVIGGGLAGCEAALFLAKQGVNVSLYEMRPVVGTPVHRSGDLAELVCSNSLKSVKADSAAGMLKEELSMLGSRLYECALDCKVDAGGALAVDRNRFAKEVTSLIEENDSIDLIREETNDPWLLCRDHDAVILATGPMTSPHLASWMEKTVGSESLSFFDAAAPIVMADSLDMKKIFSQSRYEEGAGDYLNAPFTKEEYEDFIDALLDADRVIKKEFETSDLFQACQPIEEIARKGRDAPRFGPMKPVGLTDPSTGKRPWAAVQLRAEDASMQSFNLVGFQTNLTFKEQKRVFSMIPGLENVEFARYGVMHKNTFIDSPRCLDATGRLVSVSDKVADTSIYVAGQLSGTEGYCEAIRSGLNCAISATLRTRGKDVPAIPKQTVFGSLMAYASSPETGDYQPMHVNFGIIEPLEEKVKNKGERYKAYSTRGKAFMGDYVSKLEDAGIVI